MRDFQEIFLVNYFKEKRFRITQPNDIINSILVILKTDNEGISISKRV